MAVTVGTDVYISVADADTYMTNNYISTSTEYTTWDALSDGDKEIYLKRATKRIDRQKIRGAKAVDTQTLQYPRALKLCGRWYEQPVYGVNVNGSRDWYIETAVQQNVLDANVEEALASALVDSGASSNGSERAQLQAQGVKSFKLGDLSETYGSGLSSTYNGTQLLSSEAKELLSFYNLGGVALC